MPEPPEIWPQGTSMERISPSSNVVLFTPGPVRIPPLVEEYLGHPPCNYHRQEGFRSMFAQTEASLKHLIGLRNPDAYFATIMTSTGTGGNEACLLALEGLGKGLILHNGFFAARAVDQAVQNGIAHTVLETAHDRSIDPEAVDAALSADPSIKWVFFVSHETRMGLKNPLEELGKVCKAREVFVAADIISSAWAYPLDLEMAGLDIAVASSAKAIMAAPGLAILFVRRAAVPTLARVGKPRGYYLDVVAEYEKQQAEMQTRFAQPVALHAGLHAACLHMEQVGVNHNMKRIRRQMEELAAHLASLGVHPLLDEPFRSWIAVNFRLPEGMPYREFALRMESEGYYLLYGIPGDDTHFQLSTIGDLSDEHVRGIEQAFTRVLTR